MKTIKTRMCLDTICMKNVHCASDPKEMNCRPAVTLYEADWRKVQKVIEAAMEAMDALRFPTVIVNQAKANARLIDALKQLKGEKE